MNNILDLGANNDSLKIIQSYQKDAGHFFKKIQKNNSVSNDIDYIELIELEKRVEKMRNEMTDVINDIRQFKSEMSVLDFAQFYVDEEETLLLERYDNVRRLYKTAQEDYTNMHTRYIMKSRKMS